MQYGRFPMISQIEIITIIGMYNFLRLIEGKTNAVKITIAEAETDMRETICATFNAIAFAERLYICIDSCIKSILLDLFFFLLSKSNFLSRRDQMLRTKNTIRNRATAVEILQYKRI